MVNRELIEVFSEIAREKAQRAESFVGLGPVAASGGSGITASDAKIAPEDFPFGYKAKFATAHPIMYEGTKVEGVLLLADKKITDEKGDSRVTSVPTTDFPLIELIMDACFGLLNPGAGLLEDESDIMGVPHQDIFDHDR